MRFLCCIADLYILVECKYEYTREVFKDYISYVKIMPDFTVTVTDEMIEYELDLIKADYGNVNYESLRKYVENTAVFRYIANKLMAEYDGLLFHSSSVEYDGKGYLFAAKSGTGKSTHTRLLTEYKKGEISYINDDKPFIRYCLDDDKFYVYGTPWCGKHGLGRNVKVPLKAICILKRGKNNTINKINSVNVIPEIMAQTVKPVDVETADAFFKTLSLITEKVEFYELYCNMESDAAKTSFNGMMNRGVII